MEMDLLVMVAHIVSIYITGIHFKMLILKK
jgi:hypothetical protein